MSPDDAVRLRHMLDAARQAVSFAAGKQLVDLDRDQMLKLALARLLEIIGEAARAISADTKSDNSHIRWTAIVGMRNRLIHAYFDINLEIVWQTVHHDLPVLIDQLTELLGSSEQPDSHPSS